MINIETIKEILRGIEQDEIESPDGWWETSAGAQFGQEKLKELLQYICSEQEYRATVTKVQHTDTKEWSFISTIRVRDSLVQNYKERGKLEELQNELILAITKEVKEKLI